MWANPAGRCERAAAAEPQSGRSGAGQGRFTVRRSRAGAAAREGRDAAAVHCAEGHGAGSVRPADGGALQKAHKAGAAVKEQPPQVDYLAECEKELTAGLGRKVRIVSGKRKGRIELEYYGQDDLQQLYDALHTIRKKEQH